MADAKLRKRKRYSGPLTEGGNVRTRACMLGIAGNSHGCRPAKKELTPETRLFIRCFDCAERFMFERLALRFRPCDIVDWAVHDFGPRWEEYGLAIYGEGHRPTDQYRRWRLFAIKRLSDIRAHHPLRLKPYYEDIAGGKLGLWITDAVARAVMRQHMCEEVRVRKPEVAAAILHHQDLASAVNGPAPATEPLRIEIVNTGHGSRDEHPAL